MADLIDRGALAESLFPLYNKDAADIYRIIEDAPSVNHWISCSERLPERETYVLVYIPVWKDNPIQVAYLMYDGIMWELSDGEFNFGKREVLYWMPLPEPPKGGTDNS